MVSVTKKSVKSASALSKPTLKSKSKSALSKKSEKSAVVKKDVEEETPAPKEEVTVVVEHDSSAGEVSSEGEYNSSSAEEEEEEEVARPVVPSVDEFSGSAEEIKLTAHLRKKLSAARPKDVNSSKDSCVVYLGRIPHGFYEDQMRAYFTQFGEVVRLRLSRNKKTGRSKHYAFIEFKHPDVASVVAETMDNYLLFSHILKCKVVPVERQHEGLWKGANRKFRAMPTAKIERQRHNKERTEEQIKAHHARVLSREARLRQKLESMGIEYDFPGYAACVEKSAEVKTEGMKPAETVMEPAKKAEEVKPEPVSKKQIKKQKAEMTPTSEPASKKQKLVKPKAEAESKKEQVEEVKVEKQTVEKVKPEPAKPANKKVMVAKTEEVKSTTEPLSKTEKENEPSPKETVKNQKTDKPSPVAASKKAEEVKLAATGKKEKATKVQQVKTTSEPASKKQKTVKPSPAAGSKKVKAVNHLIPEALAEKDKAAKKRRVGK